MFSGNPLMVGNRSWPSRSVAMASGWMMLRGVRRRRGFDRGFVVSDHVDFPGLMQAIAATGASRVLATHGFADPLARLLRERGLDATTLATRFTGETVGDTADDDNAGDDTDERTSDDGDAV